MSTKEILVSSGVGLLVGLGIGFVVSGNGPEAVDADAELSMSATEQPRVDEPSVQAKQNFDVARCESMLAFVKGAIHEDGKEPRPDEELIAFLEELLEKSGGSSARGTKMEFPEGVDDAYTPEVFAKSVEDLKKTCPTVFPASTRVDCEEFPCRIVRSGTSIIDQFDGSQCPQFKQIFSTHINASGSQIMGPDGKNVVVSAITPRPTGDNLEEFMKEYEGNLNKRNSVRFDDLVTSVAEETNLELCESGNAEACKALAEGIRNDDDRKMKYQRQACDGGDGSACNNLAWKMCYDHNECTPEAERLAKRATELKPNDGQGAWDTYAFILCKQGNRAAADAAYQMSCKNGSTQNCTKKCT